MFYDDNMAITESDAYIVVCIIVFSSALAVCGVLLFGQTPNELMRVSQKCLGEKHGEVISHQREAIAQLKQRLSELELAKPPGKYKQHQMQ